MYPTTNAYQTAIKAASRPYNTVYGTITLTTGEVVTVDSSVMPTNSISISKQCIEGGDLMFGGVFLSTLKLSIITSKTRYAFFGATINLTYEIQIGTDTSGETPVPIYEEIPLGIYTVADADRPQDIVNLTAYDNLTLLDAEIGDSYITGKPWEIFSYIENNTGIELAFTESDLTNFVNYNYPLQASAEQGITTFREVVKVVCQLLGCFAYADRQGKLALKKFSTSPNATLSWGDWYSCVPADYESTYVALSVTGLKGTYVKTTTEVDAIGNMMVIDDAPAWDYGADDDLQARTDNLYNYLSTITYTPSDIDMPSDPTFDCGDMIHLMLKKGGTVDTILTSIEWKFHQGMTLTSEGINPYLEGNTALATESSRILNQAVERSRLQFISFTNSREVVVGDSSTAKIGEVTFAPTSETSALFVATILIDVDVEDEEETYTEQVTVPVKAYNGTTETTITDINGNPVTLSGTATNTTIYQRDGKCDVSFYYTMNGVKIPSNEVPYVATEHIEDGKHIVTLSYPLIALTESVPTTFAIYVTSSGGTVTIPSQTMQATILGQEIVPPNGFTGKIDVSEDITHFDIGVLEKLAMLESVAVGMTDAETKSVSESIVLYNIADITVKPVSEANVQIFMQTGRLALEDGAYILLEDGGRIILEDR